MVFGVLLMVFPGMTGSCSHRERRSRLPHGYPHHPHQGYGGAPDGGEGRCRGGSEGAGFSCSQKTGRNRFWAVMIVGTPVYRLPFFLQDNSVLFDLISVAC